MKKKFTAAALTAVLLLSGCGAAEDKTAGETSLAESFPAEFSDASAFGNLSLTESTTAESLEDPVTGSSAASAQTDYQMLANEYVYYLVNGNFDELASHYNENLAQRLDAAETEAAWMRVTGKLGNFLCIKSLEAWDQKGQNYTAILTYEKKNVRVFIDIDETERLSGLSVLVDEYNLDSGIRDTDTYSETAITVGEYELNGVLTLPKNVERPPLVVLIQGSGVSDYDETIGEAGNKPFADLAAGLAERGIASIRYNKRFYQKPELADMDRLTILDEYLEDVSAAIAMASQYSDEIYLAGHSQGAMIAPAIVRDHLALAGMISLAGSPRSLQEIIYDQNMAALEGIDPAQKDAAEKQWEQILKILDELTEESNGQILNLPASYWYSLKQLDVVTAAQNLTVPMLFLQGDADFQVYAEKDFALWQKLLEGHENAEFICYEGLNHLFMPSQGKQDISEYDVPAHVDEQVIEDIASFIN